MYTLHMPTYILHAFLLNVQDLKVYIARFYPGVCVWGGGGGLQPQTLRALKNSTPKNIPTVVQIAIEKALREYQNWP